MGGVGGQSPTAPRRLPALFLSSRCGLTEAARPLPLIDRLVDVGSPIQAVVFITSQDELRQPQVRSTQHGGAFCAELADVLTELGYPFSPSAACTPRVSVLASMLFESLPAECIELHLGLDMSLGQCRELGQALQNWRDRRVLLVCLDQIPLDIEPGSYCSPYDPYWRGLMQGWVEEQQWLNALPSSLSERSKRTAPGGQRQPAETSVCLLQAAFGLGGLRLPERLFGFDLDDSQRALSGFGWMH